MDVEILNQEDFEQQRNNYLFFLKESILNGEYIINPKAIAAHWLLGVSAEQPVDECPVD